MQKMAVKPRRKCDYRARKIDPRRRTDPGATLNPGKGDVPAGNYWDWDDFLARVRGYYSGGLT